MRGAPCGGHLELWRRRKVPGLPGRRGWRASMRRSVGGKRKGFSPRCPAPAEDLVDICLYPGCGSDPVRGVSLGRPSGGAGDAVVAC
ncbi:hypothetical protein NDU88_002316 [Pleurodeles waltl]|uniref:Uncharacterized protein n=1 Tax=Pleurodeles waltl TaxID=8319 RepID=A0AAV7P9M7_PLEWA|nr:hypothetical protein NDU88_002316 [Pleurodeles waltl]